LSGAIKRGVGRGAAAVFATAAAILTLSSGGVTAAPAGPPAPVWAPSPGEMSLGSPKAPITVVEYASVGCPHCAVWATEVFPVFKQKYVDTGKVRFVLREMLTGNGTLAAAGFLTARCVAPDKYFQVVDGVYAGQETISREGIDALARIAEQAGLTREKFDACLRDHEALKALEARTNDDAKAHGVTGTPTFFVGTQKLDGEQTLEDLDAAIAHAKK
jgi:protein-disulfide isomerase